MKKGKNLGAMNSLVDNYDQKRRKYEKLAGKSWGDRTVYRLWDGHDLFIICAAMCIFFTLLLIFKGLFSHFKPDEVANTIVCMGVAIVFGLISFFNLTNKRGAQKAKPEDVVKIRRYSTKRAEELEAKIAQLDPILAELEEKTELKLKEKIAWLNRQFREFSRPFCQDIQVVQMKDYCCHTCQSCVKCKTFHPGRCENSGGEMLEYLEVAIMLPVLSPEAIHLDTNPDFYGWLATYANDDGSTTYRFSFSREGLSDALNLIAWAYALQKENDKLVEWKGVLDQHE